MGSNNNNSMDIKKGLKVFEDVLGTAWGKEEDDPTVDYSGDYEERALMTELDAQAQADAQSRATKKQARNIRSEQEQERSKKNTEWGQSNLVMSGSKELVRDARQQEGWEKEEDELLEGELREREILDKGKREANLYRIRQGVSPSTLSLGSTIYKYRR